MRGKLSPKERELLDRCVRLNNRAEAAEGALASSQAEIERLTLLLNECVKQLDMIIDRGEPTDFIQWRAELSAALSGSKE